MLQYVLLPCTCFWENKEQCQLWSTESIGHQSMLIYLQHSSIPSMQQSQHILHVKCTTPYTTGAPPETITRITTWAGKSRPTNTRPYFSLPSNLNNRSNQRGVPPPGFQSLPRWSPEHMLVSDTSKQLAPNKKTPASNLPPPPQPKPQQPTNVPQHSIHPFTFLISH